MDKMIIKELSKIAFFLQHSGLFDGFPPRTRNVLESFEDIEWAAADTSGEVSLPPSYEPTWETAEITGKFQEKPLKITIKRSESRNTYTVIYNGKKYPLANLNRLEALIDSLREGKLPRENTLQAAYKLLYSKKSDLVKEIEKTYLEGVTEKSWEFRMHKDFSRIYLRFFVRLDDADDKEAVMEKLDSEGAFNLRGKKVTAHRIDCAGSYVKGVLEENGIDVSKLDVNRNFINLASEAGFIITIK